MNPKGTSSEASETNRPTSSGVSLPKKGQHGGKATGGDVGSGEELSDLEDAGVELPPEIPDEAHEKWKATRFNTLPGLKGAVTHDFQDLASQLRDQLEKPPVPGRTVRAHSHPLIDWSAYQKGYVVQSDTGESAAKIVKDRRNNLQKLRLEALIYMPTKTPQKEIIAEENSSLASWYDTSGSSTDAEGRKKRKDRKKVKKSKKDRGRASGHGVVDTSGSSTDAEGSKREKKGKKTKKSKKDRGPASGHGVVGSGSSTDTEGSDKAEGGKKANKSKKGKKKSGS